MPIDNDFPHMVNDNVAAFAEKTTSIDIKLVLTEFCNPDGCRNTPCFIATNVFFAAREWEDGLGEQGRVKK